MKNSSKVAILLTLLALIILVICGYYFYTKNIKTAVIEKTIVQNNADLGVWVQRANEFCKNVSLATHGDDKAGCVGQSFIIENDDLMDQQYCNKVDLTPEAGSRWTKEDNRVVCMNAIAENIGDISMCVGVNSSVSVQRNNYKSCVGGIVLNKKDVSACGLDNLFPTIAGKNDCYSAMAMNLKDMSICGKISDRTAESWCYYNYYAEGGPTDVTVCEKMVEPVSSECYFTIARKTRGQGLCQKIDPGYMKSGDIYGFDPEPTSLKKICLITTDKNYGIQ